MTDRQKALEWVLTELAKYDGRFFESKPPYLVILETIRAALEAPDLAEVVRDAAEITRVSLTNEHHPKVLKEDLIFMMRDFEAKHAAAIAWAKEQSK